ncbi:hypothetical protein L6R29_25295 [Myxococcota bacterium]|nr:hypothetical protein [Myxococcota bacterium]
MVVWTPKQAANTAEVAGISASIRKVALEVNAYAQADKRFAAVVVWILHRMGRIVGVVGSHAQPNKSVLTASASPTAQVDKRSAAVVV